MLTVYHRQTGGHTNYVASSDRLLRQSSNPGSARLPPFGHENQQRTTLNKLNAFLVALNAEIKFRRYFQEQQLNRQSSPLPADVLALMHSCIELVNLIYWTPQPTAGSQGRAILDEKIAMALRHPTRAVRPDPAKMIESSSGEEMEMDDVVVPATGTPSQRRGWFANANAEERRAYGAMLMSGIGA